MPLTAPEAFFFGEEANAVFGRTLARSGRISGIANSEGLSSAIDASSLPLCEAAASISSAEGRGERGAAPASSYPYSSGGGTSSGIISSGGMYEPCGAKSSVSLSGMNSSGYEVFLAAEKALNISSVISSPLT